MKTSLSNQREQGWTLVELFVLIGLIAILVLMITSTAALSRGKARARRIQCINNLRQMEIGFRASYGLSGAEFAIARTNGGTMQFTTGPNEFRHFLIMTNELMTPTTLFCSAESDPARVQATTFSLNPKPGEVPFSSNSNLSYFVGIDVKAWETDPNAILAGDRNITNGPSIKNGILELTAKSPARWTEEMHQNVGNILLADGSVQQATTVGLREAVSNSGHPVSRLQMPVLMP